MSFALDNGDALIVWNDDGSIEGFPSDAVCDAEDALIAPGEQGSTPTGPFFPEGSPEASFLVLRRMWPQAAVSGDAPVFKRQPDELDVARPVQEAVFDEALHPRGRGGEWVRKGVLARGYAAAARLAGEGYADKMRTDYERGQKELDSFLDESRREGRDQTGENTLYVGPVNFHKWEPEPGKPYVLVSSSHIEGPSPGKSFPQSDREAIKNYAEQLVEQAGGSRHEVMRKGMRGIVEADTGEMRAAHDAVERALDENEASALYRELRERWRIPDRIVMISEKGYGHHLGITDVLVNAAREPQAHLTKLNALAIKVNEDMSAEKMGRGVNESNTREYAFKPGALHATTKSVAALLRHEWGHSLWEEMSADQRKEFEALLPQKDGDVDWDAVGEGLSKYAAGDPEDRESYRKRTSATNGYLTETFAEALAVVTDPLFKRDAWPDWVGGVSDYIDKLRPES